MVQTLIRYTNIYYPLWPGDRESVAPIIILSIIKILTSAYEHTPERENAYGKTTAITTYMAHSHLSRSRRALNYNNTATGSSA
eukprot:4371417-Pleurochrysis_carterae.AAC.1